MLQYFEYPDTFHLESGATLPGLTIAYTTYGQINEDQSNVVWICHALTANADPVEWWPGLVGEGFVIDPTRHFIICANMIGSCYGSTGPTSINPDTGLPYKDEFPLITTRDMARAHELLRKHLGIEQISLAIGGSMGGQQVLEWAIEQPNIFRRLVALATNAQHSPWGIAFNETQRMAIYADNSLHNNDKNAGAKGLEAARAIAMLSYRHYRTYGHSQQEKSDAKLDDFRAASYQQYQGEKLRKRFDAFSYISLGKSMDSHNLGRGRKGVIPALQQIMADTLVIGIETDVLFPIQEQQLLVKNIPRARIEIIHSDYGHDGFLTEAKTIGRLVAEFWEDGYKIEDRRKLLKGQLGGRLFAVPGSENF